MKALAWVLVAIVVGAGGAWYYFGSQSDGAAAAVDAAARRSDPPLVTVQHIRKQQLADTIEALGTAEANESMTVTSKISDTISKINFTDGEYVTAGDVLVELTDAQAKANLAEAKAKLDEAQNSLKRVQNLWAKKLTAKSDLDNAESQAEAAKAHYNSLAAQLADHVVRAPFSGMLGLRQVSTGALVQPSTAITTLDDISTIKLDFTVPGLYLSALRSGLPVVAHSISYPERVFRGVVSAVGTRIDAATRAVPVRAMIPNADRLLKPGMQLTVDLTTNSRQALMVPASAVYEVQDRAYVYRVDNDRRVHEQQITTGTHRYGAIEVTAGLAEGDLIVTQGIIKLRDGLLVRFEDPAPEVSRMSAQDAGNTKAVSG